MSENSMEWWRDQCPARAAGLTHAHWSECKPSERHPERPGERNGGRQHAANQCCECELTPEQEATQPEPQKVETPRVSDHPYAFTVTGRCGLQGCGLPEDFHIVKMVHTTDPAKCPVVHDSMSTKLIVDPSDGGGLQWQRCPQCNVQVEPRMSAGGPQGKSDGIGRGWVSPRMKMRWANIARNNPELKERIA